MIFATRQIVFAALIACFMSGCGAARRAADGEGSDLTLSKRTFLERYGDMHRPDELQANGSLSLRSGRDLVRVPIRWSLVRNHSLVVSVRPLPFVEAARVDVTTSAVLVRDRMGRRYFRTEFAPRDLDAIAPVPGVHPVVLKAIAQNEPFTRDKAGKEVLSSLSMHKEPGLYVFENRREGVRHEYSRDLQLVHSVLDAGEGYIAEVFYSSFAAGGMPEKVALKVTADGRVYELEVRLSSLSDAVTTHADTTPDEGYSPISLQQLIEILTSL